MESGHKPRGGFTLVEIVLALGIFSFAIVGVVFLLGNALQSSADTQRDTALSSALKTAATLIRTYDNPAVPTVLYFDQQGSQVTATTKAYYQFAIAAVAAGGNLANVELFTVNATAPYPSTNSAGTFLISRSKK